MAYEFEAAQEAESFSRSSKRSAQSDSSAHSRSAAQAPPALVEMDVAHEDAAEVRRLAEHSGSPRCFLAQAMTGQRMLKALRAHRRRAAEQSEAEMIVADLVADDGPGSIRRAIAVSPDPA